MLAKWGHAFAKTQTRQCASGLEPKERAGFRGAVSVIFLISTSEGDMDRALTKAFVGVESSGLRRRVKEVMV